MEEQPPLPAAEPINIAYIDESNLYKGIFEDGWELDYRRFRVWLDEKYKIKIAKLFTGKIASREKQYRSRTEEGFSLVFKETSRSSDGKIKGNCDAELIVEAMKDFYEKRLTRAVLISSDGDFTCLAQFLKERSALVSIVSPHARYSFLLKKLNVPIVYIAGQKGLRPLLESLSVTQSNPPFLNEKAPGGDGTPRGSFS